MHTIYNNIVPVYYIWRKPGQAEWDKYSRKTSQYLGPTAPATDTSNFRILKL